MIRGPKHLGDLFTAAALLEVSSPEDLRALALVLDLPLPDPAPPDRAAPAEGVGGRTGSQPLPGRPPDQAAPLPRQGAELLGPVGPKGQDDGPRRTAPDGAPPLGGPGGRPDDRAGAGAGAAGAEGADAPSPAVPEARPAAALTAPPVPGTPPGPRQAPRTGSLTTLNGSGPGRAARLPGVSAAPPPLLALGPAPAVRSPAPWDPRTERGVLFAAASTDVESRDVESRGLVEMAVRSAAGRSPRGAARAPRRVRPTTRQGALLLLDRSAAMAPFRDDRDWLAELAAAVLRRDRTEVREVLLHRGVSGDGGRTWEEYRPPAPGCPVLVFSDLGALTVPYADRTASSPGEWLHWLRRVRRMGNPVACLTPFPAEVYPAALRQTVALLTLDRRTSIGAVRAETRRLRDRGPRR